ncbi:PEP-CTERM sorting domain-containing protein, partial [Opitutaceae bacterium]|nr:PEP-CTERM sorting domain-containing protein [Opitutaceae bacterium]
ADKTVNVVTGSTLDVNARIQNGGIDKTGDGTLILSGGNTFTNDVDVLDGIVRVDNDFGLGSVSGGTNVSDGAQLQLDGVTVGTEALSIGGTGISGDDGALQTVTGSGTNSWAGNVAVATNAEIQVNSGTTLGISGNISGSGKTLTIESIGDTTLSGTNSLNTLNKTGAGNLTVTTSPNTISTVNVNDGTFTLGTSDILDDNLDLNVGAAGTFAMASGTETIDQFNSAGTLDIDGVFTMNGGIISGGTGADSTGELILTANNTLEIASDFTFGTVGTMGGGDQLGTLTLQDASRLVISGGSTVNIGTLNIDGDSVIDFTAADANTLNLGSLTFTAGSSLVIEGWNSWNDLWTTQNFPGANLDVRDDDTAKITFDGFSDTDTIWLTTDFGSKEITVPEPSSYGALMMAFALAAWTTRRRRRMA